MTKLAIYTDELNEFGQRRLSTWWRNFYSTMPDPPPLLGDDESWNAWEQERIALLAEWGAEMIPTYSSNSTHILFKDERDAVRFLLRWA